MPYREKTAWLTLIAMAVTFGPYFGYVAIAAPGEEVPNLRLLGWYAVAAITQLVILGIGHLSLRRSAPDDARVPPDERDRAIGSSSQNVAYHLLIFGFILVGGVMPFLSRGWTLVNASLFTIALAEFVRYSLIVVSYRRQA
ncbi:hypothetical protein HPT27_06890 [Permianibacter sp. IMCC34836]|uniref:hypothetical protein n=1 Tax=Permianibacter fluminis TaxID=2738515 RepID=UPI001557703A|nr:hypothetical protein [Permianibacter fluminis]NQD36747.1 hypothetical protein [Permianibacter fluminis]